MNKNKERLLSLAISIASLFFSLLFCEVMVRLKTSDMKNYNIEMWRYSKILKEKTEDPTLPFTHKSSVSAELQGVTIRLNSNGLRGAELPENYKDMRKILFLGASATLGWGLEEEQTFPHLTGEALGTSVLALNAGIGNYPASYYVKRGEDISSKLKPDAIVVQFYPDDIRLPEAPRSNLILEHSQLAVITWAALQNFLRENFEIESYYKEIWAEDSPEIKSFRQNLAALASYSNSENIPVLFVAFPDLHFLDDYPLAFAHRMAEKEVLNQGMHFKDLLYHPELTPDFHSYWVQNNDAHPNAKIHAMAAQVITQFFNDPESGLALAEK